MGKVKTVDFSETIAACDLKVGRCRQLIELMVVNASDSGSRGRGFEPHSGQTVLCP